MTVALSSSWITTLVMAVDRSKFRTCDQVSFCRRHRLPIDSNDASGFHSSMPKYNLSKSSLQVGFAVEEESSKKPAQKWSNIFSRQSKDLNGGADPYRRGPKPYVTASLVPEATSEFHPPLDLTLSWQLDGSIRLRITEIYSEGKFSPRWTTDELVLTEIERTNPLDKLSSNIQLEQLSAEELAQYYLNEDGPPLSQENFVAFKYTYLGKDHDDMGAPSQPTVVVLRYEPFSLYLYTSTNKLIPSVTMNSRQLMHFEHVRPRDAHEAEMKRRAEEVEEDDRHKGKEIVGYWEDGLAIYADGTREEKREVAAVSQDLENGLWEESFHSHKDSKPRGPMSVGVDLSFPNTQHLYGLPEHASSLKLQSTIGPDRHYNDPYRLYNLDVFEYELDQSMALYGAVPLVVAHNLDHTVGVFYFNPTETFVDVSPSIPGTTSNEGRDTHWISESGIIDIFFLPGPSPQKVYRQYADLTGFQELPPMFALGYHQCRWNYRDQADVYAVHREFEALNYPYDVLWLDIEHTDDKRYFTWDSCC